MKTIVKLLIAAALLNAAARGARAAWTYYQLKDAAQQVVLFGAGSSESEIHSLIVEEAAELGVPLRPEDVSVERVGPRTRATAAYVQPVEFFPNYRYPVDFSFSVEGLALNSLSR